MLLKLLAVWCKLQFTSDTRTEINGIGFRQHLLGLSDDIFSACQVLLIIAKYLMCPVDLFKATLTLGKAVVDTLSVSLMAVVMCPAVLYNTRALHLNADTCPHQTALLQFHPAVTPSVPIGWIEEMYQALLTEFPDVLVDPADSSDDTEHHGWAVHEDSPLL